MDEILKSLNEEQILPVRDTEGAVLVLAGAGSGKTRVLTARIAYILDRGLCSPSNMLAITFTNKAANEMKERVETALGDIGGMWICTIHSMCVKILRRFGGSLGITPNFSIYSETERANVIKKVFKEMDLKDELLKGAKYHIANAKMLGLDPDQYAVRFKQEANIKEMAAVLEAYNKYLRESNALDFDDLLVETLRLLRSDENAKEYLSDKFKYILVDEFQDTNAVQYNIIKLLASGHGNLFVVGDDDQSIYGWRGAEIENILSFDSDFPQAKVYKLQRNYRSTKSILNLANVVIAKNGNRHEKTLWTEAEEGVKPEYVQSDDEKDEALFAAKTINAAIYAGGRYSDFAILMRINALTRSYEQEFGKYGIPYKVFGGFKFFERREIKDVMAYMRLISNPFDNEAFLRIVNVPRRGIGQRTVEIMDEYARGYSLSLFDACVDADRLPLSAAVKKKLKDFAAMLKQLVVFSINESVGDLVREIISATNLKSAYDDKTGDGDAKLANLDEFIAAVDDFVRLNPQATLDEYLNQITLASDADEMNDGNYVTLATIHSVKGLEFENVIICGLEDGIMPTSRASDEPSGLEEERRLMYVAVTRAKKRLYLTRSKSRYLYGHREMTTPSRFIGEMGSAFVSSSQSSSYGARRSSYGGYGSSYGYRRMGETYGGYGYDGDFWESPAPAKSGRSVYSSDDGYTPDYVPDYGDFSKAQSSRPAAAERKKQFSPSATFSQTPKPQAQGAKSYAVGCVVRHPKFGKGTVIAVKNGGAVVDIAFEGHGIKELSATIAPLEIIK